MRTKNTSTKNLGKGDWSLESILSMVLEKDMQKGLREASLPSDVIASLIALANQEREVLLNVLSAIGNSCLANYSADSFLLQITHVQRGFSMKRELLVPFQDDLSSSITKPNDILYVMVREAFLMAT